MLLEILSMVVEVVELIMEDLDDGVRVESVVTGVGAVEFLVVADGGDTHKTV